MRKPEILYAVIEAHPAEFMQAVERAAQASKKLRRASAMQSDSTRIEGDLRNPLAPVIQHRAVLGNPNAPITIVEYTDFECPYCREERSVLIELMKQYGDKVRLLVKQMPIPELHAHAMDAALMYEAVARQDPGKAYQLYDDLYEHQEQFARQGQPYLEQAVARLGLDSARAVRDQRSDVIRAVVDADVAEGKRFGITGTPGFVVNGVLLQGAYPLAPFQQLIDRQLAALPSTAGRAGASVPQAVAR